MRTAGVIRSALFLLLLLIGANGWSEVCKGSKIPAAELREYDAQADLSPDDQAVALQTHLPFGTPACPRLLPGLIEGVVGPRHQPDVFGHFLEGRKTNPYPLLPKERSAQ